MKKIDTYIIKLFLIFYTATFAGFLIMMIVMHVSGNIAKFSREGNLVVNILVHYLSEIPFYINLMLPIISVMAAIFTIISLKRRNELARSWIRALPGRFPL